MLKAMLKARVQFIQEFVEQIFLGETRGARRRAKDDMQQWTGARARLRGRQL